MRCKAGRSGADAEYAARSIELTRVKLEQVQSDLDRATIQLQNKIISQEQYDHTSQAYRTAKASLGIAQAQGKVAGTELDEARADIERATLTSPVDGVVARRWAEEGETVQPAHAIYTVYDLAHLWIEANFKETQIAAMKVGDAATSTVDAFPGRRLSGRVASIGATTASATSGSSSPP